MKRVMRVERHVIFVGVEPEGKRSLGRRRYKWEYNIKMNLLEV
jgi:hypothetical protein